MYSFFDKTVRQSNLEISIEWNPPLNEKTTQRMILVHVESFLDVYRNITEQQLGLAVGLTKKAWLTKMITDEIEEIKNDNIPYACAYIQDQLIGFATCDREHPRYNPTMAKANHLFKNDIYVRLLAIRPIKYLFKHYDINKIIDNYPIEIQKKLNSEALPENIRTGLGRFLIDSIGKKFPNANAITLDTRYVNENARQFYEHIGFRMETITFGGSDPNYYAGYEKEISHSLKC
jgi:hypothetical protein